MSHTVKIQTKFTQLDPLKKAFAHFGWEIVENKKARVYRGDPKENEVYPLVAVNPDTDVSRAYDIGIRMNGKELEVHCDFFGGSIQKSLGENMNKLRQEYAFRVIEEKYAYEGASVMRTTEQDGSMTIDVEMHN